ncbi:MAG TPA: endonuclease/exonuclease/phosphatase family protein [Chthoniobacter sp.]|jgi:hypothetical protein
MNWNIQKFGPKKAGMPPLINNIARVIVEANVDIAIILELAAVTGDIPMKALTTAVNALAAAAGQAHIYDYRGSFLSYPTAGDCYGVLIKDMDQIRPIVPMAGY